ncbi:hypothetical protein HETIRDRAFT_331191 [Heterobasidion irregulare TC 32-1]|uniref:Uncharacterized protein n=1 Tax=Heterobasidion irregulare (strain TC 32-1) TaxID=747525 RepID=W4JNP5_HETIT|nr:uncharacterized protein HETIRDRAFT_331191 [Heterobasidion irregulare TC 32-1]ETW75163.1 hypothetical protein HETIRDRAFT_331191 [Heterobasidion irregulare TC 32-1]
MTQHDISLGKATVISTALEAVLYGFSLMMFIETLWVLLRRARKDISVPMVSAAAMLFTFSTIHIGINIYYSIQGLVHNVYPIIDQNSSELPFILKLVIYWSQTITGDAIIIYRCYVVWQSFYVILLPITMLCGVGVTGAISVWAYATSSPATLGWMLAFYILTLSANLLYTSLLSFGIWRANRTIQKADVYSAFSLIPIIFVIIDAGAIYTIALLASLLCLVNDQNGVLITLDLAVPIISITFYMVIVRVGMPKTSGVMGADGTGTTAFTTVLEPGRDDGINRMADAQFIA